MSNALIKFHFTRTLAALGYPTEDINYSLGYSQGDGVAMYGDIDTDGLTAMAQRLLKGPQKAGAKRAIAKGCTASISRNSFGNLYSHYNTMQVNDESHYAEELTEYEESAFSSLIEAIEQEVVSTSKQLESDGYAIVEAGSSVFTLDDKKRTFETARFLVEIEEVEEEDFNIDDWDESLQSDFLDSLIAGKQRYFCLKVSVSGHDGIELGTSYLGCCTQMTDKHDRTYGGYLRQLVAEAISEARDTIAAISLPIAC